jgi:hypothetical protein
MTYAELIQKISDYTESKFISNLQKVFNDPSFIPKIGFFIANDLSSRSLAVLGEGMVNRYEYWGMSKSFSNFLPVSEKIWIPKNLVENGIPCVSLKTTLNNEERQNEKTKDKGKNKKNGLSCLRGGEVCFFFEKNRAALEKSKVQSMTDKNGWVNSCNWDANVTYTYVYIEKPSDFALDRQCESVFLLSSSIKTTESFKTCKAADYESFV